MGLGIGAWKREGPCREGDEESTVWHEWRGVSGF